MSFVDLSYGQASAQLLFVERAVYIWPTGNYKSGSVKYRVIRNDCRGFNNLSYTTNLR
jgi:hypothetical protein